MKKWKKKKTDERCRRKGFILLGYTQRVETSVGGDEEDQLNF